MTTIETFGGREPAKWYLVFHPNARHDWLSALTPGRFKHVSAFGYVAGFKVWVCVDANWHGLQTVLYSHDSMKMAFVAFVDGGAHIVEMPESDAPMRWRSRLGLTCVSAAKHVARVRSFALTPTGLYHHALRNGGQIIGARENSDRPSFGDRASAGAE